MTTLKTTKTDKLVILLWGPALSGKTILASQFPNPYFIDLDGQLGSVRALANSEDKGDFDFPTIYIDETETEDKDFLDLCGKSFSKLRAWKKTLKLVEQLAYKLPENSTLVLDNLSRASEYLLYDIKKRANRDTLQIQDWGTFIEEMKILIDYLHSKYTKCNTVLIGHESSTKNDVTGDIIKSVLMPTTFKERLPSKASDFLYMTTDVSGPKSNRKVVRKLQSVPDPRNQTGSRSLIPDVENPTYEKLKPYFEAYLGKPLGEATWTPGEIKK